MTVVGGPSRPGTRAGIKHLRRLAAAWLILLGGGLSPAAGAAEPAAPKFPELEYAAPDQSVWTTRLGPNGEPDNPLLGFAASLFAKAGIPWHGRSYPAIRLFTYLQNGTAQFAILVKAPQLQDCCLFSTTPITTAEIRVYRRSGAPPIKQKEDLAGKSVITIRGYSYGGLLTFLADERQRIVNNATATHSSAFAMLKNRRADYVIDYAGPAGEILAAEPQDDVAFDVLSRQDVHLVLSKTYPDAPEVMARLEAIARTLDVKALMRQP